LINAAFFPSTLATFIGRKSLLFTLPRLSSSRRKNDSFKMTAKMTTKRDTTMVEDIDRDSVSIDKEAQTTSHQIKPGMTAEDAEWLASIPPQEQARIFHKVDRRLVPMLALL
jgi:hypothetical protein